MGGRLGRRSGGGEGIYTNKSNNTHTSWSPLAILRGRRLIMRSRLQREGKGTKPKNMKDGCWGREGGRGESKSRKKLAVMMMMISRGRKGTQNEGDKGKVGTKQKIRKAGERRGERPCQEETKKRVSI